MTVPLKQAPYKHGASDPKAMISCYLGIPFPSGATMNKLLFPYVPIFLDGDVVSCLYVARWKAMSAAFE